MSWVAQESPFEYLGPVSPDKVIGRQDELAALHRYALSGGAVVIYAPRRFGKTSLLNRAVTEIREAGDVATVLVDLYGAQTLADVSVRVERAYSSGLTGPVRQAVSRLFERTGLGLSLSAMGIGVHFQRYPRADPLPALHALLDVPRLLGEQGTRSWVVFDEFQELLAVPGAEGILRSHVQHHRAFAGYAFAGSERTLLQRMFADSERPFFGQAEAQRLPRLPPRAVADAVAAAFERTERSPGGVLDRLIAVAEGHPQRTMLLAHYLWVATGHGQVADHDTWREALDAAIAATSMGSATRWDRLSVNQRRVVRALVEFGTAYSLDAASGAGLRLGSVAATLQQLVGSGDLEEDADRRGERFIDPLFPLWVRREILRTH